jgi:predicted house-cleaning NTP pyrophosphatase (Maf/HAM1 superfamily)
MDQDPNFCKYTLGFDPLRTYGGTFVKEIKGSFNNLRGIPLEVVIEMLKDVDYEIE